MKPGVMHIVARGNPWPLVPSPFLATALLNGVEGQHNKNLKKFSHHIFLAVFLDAGQEVHAHHLSALEEPKSRSVGMKTQTR